ncbi:phosphoribosylformylglycinamidine synthase subunit PurQ [Leptospira gomenensis]|uniref:Phosphoribosylformylglycinamidine synthase subunit PurQ n=1 Tax=Leptospira gomenensis TaxID=2484974 RepID=A0A5F1YB56_9LEPT|nr:phosphoribosylformylglycinamidine synthase subunit PurQ [Leptospira gomenensis]TGK34592.1 phosphoribosylformylglycinamidine synthase subunit PurQ [Leptospira gomenensis]TGK40098.1 phosphoribosylformylglycinamidine synthase subunit PurQ [Leptospira gomenensis]TGK40492.1 phosphoribosylformylglycinamidine synthase subunit PurQ [Leptospira gomenensis]TGK55607.1 phosphoribosylformylglycinamidine synthase subunit PurQ [Leptospira gomenensis]
MKVAVITFPGSNCDADIYRVLRDQYGAETDRIWHRDQLEKKYDLVVLPGGFSYGDYLRSGAMAGFSPVMKSVKEHVEKGGKLFGICNGFQILTEAGFLPGALTRNKTLKYICKTVVLKKGSSGNAVTASLDPSKELRIPIAHADGCYYATSDVLKQLEEEGRILFRYSGENPNGSLDAIAGITSKDFKVAGMMPHPERAMNSVTGDEDGKVVLDLILGS